MVTTAIPSRTRWTAERRFFTGLAIAAFIVVYVGFARTFFLRPWFPDAPAPSESIFLVHGVVFACWSVLLVVQASLVALGRYAVHRTLGIVGVALAASMVVLGVAGALVAAGRSTGFVGLPVPPLQFLIVPIADMTLFATFVALAVLRRYDAQAHKRWMILATVNLLVAAFARWPGVISIGNPFVYMGLADLFIVALVAWDLRTRGRLHPATLWGGLAVIASQPLRLALSGTAAWLAVAGWAVSLVR
ncbi:MAG TPA: hypothetical protein VD737_00625 [Steroidobacteraceae bacterium]|nr:hypothetical protein [Steroidobacteraceae bacterium]